MTELQYPDEVTINGDDNPAIELSDTMPAQQLVQMDANSPVVQPERKRDVKARCKDCERPPNTRLSNKLLGFKLLKE